MCFRWGKKIHKSKQKTLINWTFRISAYPDNFKEKVIECNDLFAIHVNKNGFTFKIYLELTEKHLKKYSTLLIIRKVQMKTTMR